MNILLDTHALVWWLTDNPRLSVRVRAAMTGPENVIFVSAASGWEVATKVRFGKWPEAARLLDHMPSLLAEGAFSELPVTLAHAVAAGQLLGDHRDPFDRILAAQCSVEDLALATIDPVFQSFGTRIL